MKILTELYYSTFTGLQVLCIALLVMIFTAVIAAYVASWCSHTSVRSASRAIKKTGQSFDRAEKAFYKEIESTRLLIGRMDTFNQIMDKVEVKIEEARSKHEQL